MIERIGRMDTPAHVAPVKSPPAATEPQAPGRDRATISAAAKRQKAGKRTESSAAARAGNMEIPAPNPGAGVFAEPFGKITHLALQLDNEAHGYPVAKDVLNAWTTVFKTMDSDVKFTIVVERQQDKDMVLDLIRKNDIPDPGRFTFVLADDIDITMWSRDQMVGLFSPTDDTTLLGQTTMRPHGDDPLLPPRIAKASTGIVLDPDKRLVTDGGDEVSNSTETFLGYNSLYLTAKHLYDQEHPGRKKEGSPFSHQLVRRYPEGKEHYQVPDFYYRRNPHFKGFPEDQSMWLGKAKALFEEKYGKPVTVVGADDPATPEHEQPATFHIDMGLTPVDDRTMLVGDPGLAVDIIGKMPKDEYDACNRHLQEALGLEGDILRKLVDANTKDDALLQHQFDYNAAQMEKKGYTVIRLPYLQGPPDVSWVTYNNCLMETYRRDDGSEVRRVFLPTFGLPALDRKAEEVYKEQGFEVVPLELPALTSWRGAIRCISNILGRSPEA